MLIPLQVTPPFQKVRNTFTSQMKQIDQMFNSRRWHATKREITRLALYIYSIKKRELRLYPDDTDILSDFGSDFTQFLKPGISI